MTALSLAVVLALSTRAEKLVHELGSPSFREREAAQAELLAIGGPALPAVGRAVTNTDPEVAKRARGLARDIGFRVDCARLLAPTPVELEFTNAPLSAVLTALSVRSGYSIGLLNTGPNPDTTTVTLRTGSVTFWKAVEELGKVSGLSVHHQTAASPTTVRFFTPGAAEAVPKTPGEKVAALIADVDLMYRFANRLDPNGANLLINYREELRRIPAELERNQKLIDAGREGAGPRSRVETLVSRAESLHAAAKNLFLAAGQPVAFGAGGKPAVILGPATGIAGSFHAGVRVETVAGSPPLPQPSPQVEVLGKARGMGIPSPSGPIVFLKVVPEPKIEWVRTTGVRVEHALDDRGQPVVPNLSPQALTSNRAEEAMVLQARLLRSSLDASGQVVRPNSLQTFVPLKCELPAPATLREFRGVVQGLVRADPGEVVVQPLTIERADGERKQPAAADARQLVIRMGNLSAQTAPAVPVLTATAKRFGDDIELDVALLYSTDLFTPVDDGIGNRNLQTTQQFRAMRGAGGIVDVQGLRGNYSTKAETVYGLRVTDAAGRPFRLSGTGEMTRTFADGSGSVSANFRLAVTPSDTTNGPPVRISWTATRFAPVEVPFDLKHVPVTK